MTCRIISFSLKSFLVNQSRPASYRQFQNVGSLFSATNHSSSSAAYSARPIVLAQFNSLRSFHSSSSRCSDGGRHDNEIPPLMGQVRRIIVPNLFKSIGNFFQTILIIKPYFDSDFTLTEFIQVKQLTLFHQSAVKAGYNYVFNNNVVIRELSKRFK